MGYIKVWLHIVWTTKNRKKILTAEARKIIFNHIRENALSKGIYVDHINGHLEHVHCLISLGPEQTIAKTVMLLKGESSYWTNKNRILPVKLEWQEEYFAVSVSESAINRVRSYIRNQENHHKKKTFTEEYQEFIKKYNFETIDHGSDHE